jgi:translation initiation factor IF-3
MARESGLDLVLISPNVQPPVCKIADYGKLRYELIKKEKEAKKGQKAGILKELKLTPNIGEHDYQVVFRKAVDFLGKKNKVKVTLKFRGREVTHPEVGARVLQRLITELAQIGTPERPPKLEGKHYWMMLTPKQ